MPRKKKDEETQPEAEATEEVVAEETPAEAPAEEKPKKRAPRKKAEVVDEAPADDVVEVAEVSEGETERVGAVVEPEEAPAPQEAPVAEEPPVAEEAPAEEAPADDESGRAGSVIDEEAQPAAEEPAPEVVAAPEKKKRKRLPRPERRQRTKPKRPASTGRKAIVRLPKPEHARGQRKERRGIVVSSVMDKTIVVRVETVKPHPVYKKIVRRSTKFHAHDERNVAKAGDLVRIVESRPFSKTKNWRLVEVLEEAK